MFGSLRGKILRIDGVTVLIEVSGVGYEVEMPVTSLAKISVNEEEFIYVHHVVREDDELLYGFCDLSDRTLFRELIKVNGVGPKLALAILSSFNAHDFIAAVTGGRTSALVKVPGIGKKTAERLVVELKDKLDKLPISADAEGASFSGKENGMIAVVGSIAAEEAVSALIGLGYKENLAHEYVNSVAKEGMDTKQIIVAALALISGGKR